MKGLPRLRTLTWASHKYFPTPQPSFSLCRSRTQRNRSRESLDASLSDNSVQVRCYRGLIERESKKLFSLTGATWRTPVIRERSRSSTLLPSVPSHKSTVIYWFHGHACICDGSMVKVGKTMHSLKHLFYSGQRDQQTSVREGVGKSFLGSLGSRFMNGLFQTKRSPSFSAKSKEKNLNKGKKLSLAHRLFLRGHPNPEGIQACG